MLMFFNPIALKLAKTLWSFGHSECNRVKSDRKVPEKKKKKKKQSRFPRSDIQKKNAKNVAYLRLPNAVMRICIATVVSYGFCGSI